MSFELYLIVLTFYLNSLQLSKYLLVQFWNEWDSCLIHNINIDDKVMATVYFDSRGYKPTLVPIKQPWPHKKLLKWKTLDSLCLSPCHHATVMSWVHSNKLWNVKSSTMFRWGKCAGKSICTKMTCSSFY